MGNFSCPFATCAFATCPNKPCANEGHSIITNKLEDRKSKEMINFLLTNDTERELLNVQEICNDEHVNEYEAMDFHYHYSDRVVDSEIDTCNINIDLCDDMKVDSEVDTSSIDTNINLYDDREENSEIDDRDINLYEIGKIKKNCIPNNFD